MHILEPADVDELSSVLREASAARRTLVPVGNRTRLKTLPPSAASASLLTLKRMPIGMDHVAGDLVATLPASMTLADANRALGREGQWLPLDPPFPSSTTIGGIVSANESGPRRYRYGAPRDVIIGISMMLADGRMAKAGGRVVKNVAGYDLARLMCGSLGSLAVITSATFKLSPIAQASRTVVAALPSTDRLADLVQALVNAPITPSTIELVGPPLQLLIRVESTPKAADHMAKAAAAICLAYAAPASIPLNGDENAVWDEAERAVWNQQGSVLKVSVLPTDVAYLVGEISRGCDANRVSWSVFGRAALGVLFVRVDGDPQAIRSLVADWRHRASVHDGSLVVHSAALGLASIPRWGDAPAAMPMMRAIKARFDPHGILSPGMGPGGL
jgi:glycolate oxidase FAD binding subunit